MNVREGALMLSSTRESPGSEMCTVGPTSAATVQRVPLRSAPPQPLHDVFNPDLFGPLLVFI